ncbi:hypothetical protein S83_051479 [Arachis hypogaea]
MNLTAVKDANEVMERYVEDSLAILPPLRDCYRTCCGGAPSHEKLSLVDIGTGAGFSRVIFAIACPGCICGCSGSVSLFPIHNGTIFSFFFSCFFFAACLLCFFAAS